jgi:UDPglucose--hexose-1-phosphate uridylyltransferase
MDYSKPHRRYNPLTREWVLVSPHRALRPWQGQVEKIASEVLPKFDPECYLCPGNIRAGGKKNPNYQSTFVFDNDYPALLPAGIGNFGDGTHGEHPLVSDARPVSGICRVVCFSPRHDLSLPEMENNEIENVITTWITQTVELGALDTIDYVQVFENKGAVMGCSNPHPHSQIWATSFIPNEPLKEIHAFSDYTKENNSCLLCDYLSSEIQASDRILASNNFFLALVPFWAIWPFEVMIISKRHISSLKDLRQDEISGLAAVMKEVTTMYDNLFEISFPYSMGFHQAPTDGLEYPGYHLHAHYYPPLLRSATVKKFMVGFEMLAMPQRDLTPETAARKLRSLSKVHFRQRNPTG